MAASGARLVLGDLDADELHRVATTLSKRGAEVLAQPCDICSEQQVRELVAAGVAAFGRLDIAVNNAGIATPMRSLLDTEEADLDRCFAVNAKGVFVGMKHQIRQMLSQGRGTILNVSSMAGIGWAPKLSAF